MHVLSKSNPRVGTQVHAFRAHLAAYQLLADLKRTHIGRKVRMLDVGGSHGIHARFFRSHGIHVDLVDMKAGDEPPIFVGDYLQFVPEAPYDVVWSSHVLEHVRNVGLFLDKMAKDLAPDGYCVATVPPIRPEKMAYNHLSLWNAGMLLLNFGMAGFDMTTARIATYGYNVSIIARLAVSMPDDIKDAFPKAFKVSERHFNGDFHFFNWDKPLQRSATALPMLQQNFPSRDDALAALRANKESRFCRIVVDGKAKLHYLDEDKLVPTQ
jgi:SAM-dependent methyltransferase